jgi:Asp-tRNA(Asn)/Glu-tRNA(Gln) amidotransferase A subunit family amidase
MVAAGAIVREINVPNLGWLRLAHALKISSEFSIGWDAAYHSPNSDLLEPATRITVALGATSTALDVLAAEKLRGWAFEHVHAIFDGGVDAIVTPTTSVTAPVIDPGALEAGESNTPLQVELLKYVFLCNFLGLPGISVPVGSDSTNAGMPIGLQLMGAQWSEDVLLNIANQMALPIKNPPSYVDVLRK